MHNANPNDYVSSLSLSFFEKRYDLPDFAKTYFDYEKFSRDLFMTDYWFDDGYVFRIP